MNQTWEAKTENNFRRVSLPDGKCTTLSIAAKKLRDETDSKNGIKDLPDGAKDFMYNGKTLWELALQHQRANIEA